MSALAGLAPVVQGHLAAALIALILGAVVLAASKGTPVHKAMGRMWVALLVVISLGSFWIREINDGGFSAIHVLSVVTLLSLAYAIYSIRRGRVRSHRLTMIAVYAGGMIGAGLGALAPGRVLSGLLFGP